MSSNIVMIVFKTTGYTEVEATTFIQSLLEVSGVKISIRPAQVASGTYVVIVQKSEELDDFLECNSQPVTGAGGKSYHCYEAGATNDRRHCDTAKDRASRTLFVTFPIETTEDEIREIFAKYTYFTPKILPARDDLRFRATNITVSTHDEMMDLMTQIKCDYDVVDVVPYCPRAQRMAEIAKKYEDQRFSLMVNYRDCNVYISGISTAGVDMAALREKFAQSIGDCEIIRQTVFDPKEGAETTVGFVQFATPATAAEFVAAINGKANAEVFEGLFVEEFFEGEEKVEKVTEQGKRVIKATIVHPKEEHVSAKQAAAPEATINDEERTRRGNFAYPLINTFINEHPEAVALVDAIVAKHQTADITEDERVTNIEDVVALCTGIIIDKQFGNFDQEFTENIRYYVMNVLNEIKDE